MHHFALGYGEKSEIQNPTYKRIEDAVSLWAGCRKIFKQEAKSWRQKMKLMSKVGARSSSYQGILIKGKADC